MRNVIGATIGALIPVGLGGWALLDWRSDWYTDNFLNIIANIIVNLTVIIFLFIIGLFFAFIGGHIQKQLGKTFSRWHGLKRPLQEV